MTEIASRKLTINEVYWRRPNDPDHMGDPVPDLAERLREFDYIPRVGDSIDTEDHYNEVVEVKINLTRGEKEAPYGTINVYVS